jgi:hypothetical protein
MTTMATLQGLEAIRRARPRTRVLILAGATVVAIVALGAAGEAAARGHHHRHHHGRKAQVASGRVLHLARCYGRFIAWRDELGGLMQASGAYTPSPGAPARFDRVEASFIDSAHKDMGVLLHLRPTFAEADFPDDVRQAFQAGLKETTALFAADDYRARRKAVLDQPDMAPIPRMASLEANADASFKPLGEPCDQLAAANP